MQDLPCAKIQKKPLQQRKNEFVETERLKGTKRTKGLKRTKRTKGLKRTKRTKRRREPRSGQIFVGIRLPANHAMMIEKLKL